VIWSAVAVALIIAVPAGVQAARDALPDPIDDDTNSSSTSHAAPTPEATTTTTREPATTVPTTAPRRPTTTVARPAPDPTPSGWSGGTPGDGFANCDAARAAGAAPVYRGDPGFHERLDRDSDGVGCE
jgi:hypothetical protein